MATAARFQRGHSPKGSLKNWLLSGLLAIAIASSVLVVANMRPEEVVSPTTQAENEVSAGVNALRGVLRRYHEKHGRFTINVLDLAKQESVNVPLPVMVTIERADEGSFCLSAIHTELTETYYYDSMTERLGGTPCV